jgi:hypothetical protein
MAGLSLGFELMRDAPFKDAVGFQSKSGIGETVSKLENRSGKIRKTLSKHLRLKSKRAISLLGSSVFSSIASGASFETISGQPHSKTLARFRACLSIREVLVV